MIIPSSSYPFIVILFSGAFSHHSQCFLRTFCYIVDGIVPWLVCGAPTTPPPHNHNHHHHHHQWPRKKLHSIFTESLGIFQNVQDVKTSITNHQCLCKTCVFNNERGDHLHCLVGKVFSCILSRACAVYPEELATLQSKGLEHFPRNIIYSCQWTGSLLVHLGASINGVDPCMLQSFGHCVLFYTS